VEACCIKLRDMDLDYKFWFVMDNVKFHNEDKIKEVLKKYGHELHYLPRYSPQFNPIEYCFSRWKKYAHRRKMECTGDLYEAMQDGAELINREMCTKTYQMIVNNWYTSVEKREDF
jgi:hypothetical protein